MFSGPGRNMASYKESRELLDTPVCTPIYVEDIRSILSWDFKFNVNLKKFHLTTITKWIMSFDHLCFCNIYVFLHCHCSDVMNEVFLENIMDLICNISTLAYQYHHGYLTEKLYVPTKIKINRVWNKKSQPIYKKDFSGNFILQN